MASPETSAQTKIPARIRASEALASLLLYLPYGVAYPFAKGWDFFTWLKKKNPSVCYHCQQNPAHYHKTHLDRFNQRFRILEQKGQRGLAQFFSTLGIQDRLLRTLKMPDWLSPAVFVWGGLLPATAIAAIYAFVGSWPLIYLTLLATSSFWSGLVINTVANLIVLQEKAPEYDALAHPTRYNWKEYIGSLTTRLGRDLLIAHLISDIKTFYSFCTAAFDGWLMVYVGTKIAVNQSSPYINQLEAKLTASSQVSEPDTWWTQSKNVCENFSWYVGYQALYQLGSYQAIDEYEQAHAAKFHTHNTPKR